jgi:hypothetical protein
MALAAPSTTAPNITTAVDAIERNGLTSLTGFGADWCAELLADFWTAWNMVQRHRGVRVRRGANRWRFPIHPQDLRGNHFLDLVTHPEITRLCETMLGSDYTFYELVFDVGLAGAPAQPWHRDYPHSTKGITRLAFQVPAVTTDNAFEYAPGTHRDDGSAFESDLFPDRDVWDRYDRLAQKRQYRAGGVLAGSPCTIRRGTAITGVLIQPVLVLGAVARRIETNDTQPPQIEHSYTRLPAEVRRHVRSIRVGRLTRPATLHIPAM